MALLCLLAGSALGCGWGASSQQGTEATEDSNARLGDVGFAIVLIDVWDTAPVEYWMVDGEAISTYGVWYAWWEDEVVPHKADKIEALLDVARRYKIPVVFAPHERELSKGLGQNVWLEPIISQPWDLDAYLKGMNITTILYAGYATNLCVLVRPCGMRKLAEMGYEVILIEDCALAVPWYHYTGEMALEEIRQLGGLTTLDEIRVKLGDIPGWGAGE